MINIDWDEFREYKKHAHSTDNFEITLGFLKSYYNVVSPLDVFDSLINDDIGQMMLNKRDITCAEDLEPFLFKARS